jgi:hypothetical protein
MSEVTSDTPNRPDSKSTSRSNPAASYREPTSRGLVYRLLIRVTTSIFAAGRFSFHATWLNPIK